MLREDRRTDGAAESGSAAAPHRRRSVARSRKNECRALRGANTKLRRELDAIQADRKAERGRFADFGREMRDMVSARDNEIAQLKRTIATDTATLAGQKASLDDLDGQLSAMTEMWKRADAALREADARAEQRLDEQRQLREEAARLAAGKLTAMQQIVAAATAAIVALQPDDILP